ncbi:ABC transporter ATP-binding protein [Mangrovihabitans endophyticus]|uniref:ABC transporter ATP-binding protein n=1 Tax=Mangrovihabitans endophyticus TaxID=1751298 RepID=A0A8J3C2T7_9ACTN|nr:ABC transporter ATP-binding protein [Mangrovihabitans endophyticus]GGL09412.1 ABC transporter ATP-binding protein [Mangrovihabitans endophyticus]
MVESLLSVRGVAKSFGGLRVLHDVSLDVVEGGITGLIGPNGSGKSTLFDVITRYQRCDAGRVTFAGEPLDGLAPHAVARRGLIRTFQLTRVFPSLTVAENLLVFARSARARPGGGPAAGKAGGGGEGETRAVELLDVMGLLGLAHREAAGLSYGQQKLLEIAQVLMLGPRLLLLDEPMAGINPGLADEVVDRLKALRTRGMTLLLVEHDIPVLHRLCDQVVVLNAGRVMAGGAPGEVLDDPHVREAFLGE